MNVFWMQNLSKIKAKSLLMAIQQSLFTVLASTIMLSCSSGGLDDTATMTGADKVKEVEVIVPDEKKIKEEIEKQVREEIFVNSPSIGTESLVFDPEIYEFGLVSSQGAAAKKVLNIKNVSEFPAFIGSVEASPNASFTLLSENCPKAPEAFPPAAHCEATVLFLPAIEGELSWEVYVFFAGKPEEEATLTAHTSLSGGGVLPLNFAGLNPIDAASVSTTRAKLTWESVTGASSFAIYNTDESEITPYDTVSGTTTQYILKNLNPSSSYHFMVKALNALGEQDRNTVIHDFITDAIGSFSAIASVNTEEGSIFLSPDYATYCTDSEGNKPSSFSIVSQSDPQAACTVPDATFKVRCEPTYKTGHSSWQNIITLSCLLNDYPTAFTQTLTVDIADTNRTPTVAAITNKTVAAGMPMEPVDVNGILDRDADLDPLTYNCRYDTFADGSVLDTATLCSTLLNQDGSNFNFDPSTGIINWTPPTNLAGQAYDFKIYASDGSLVSSTLFKVTVIPPPPSPSTSNVTVSSATVGSGSSVNVTLQAKDAFGNALVTGGHSISFSYSGGSSTYSIGTVSDNGDGTYSADFTGIKAGSVVTLSAKINGVSVVTAMPTLQVFPGPIAADKSLISLSSSSVASSQDIAITLTAKDTNSNRITSGGAVVVFSRSGGTSTGAFSATVDNGNGTYSSNFTGAIAGSPTTIGGTINATTISSTLPQVTVVPGVPSAAQSQLSVSAATVNSGQSVSISLTLRDAQNNLISTGGEAVVFSLSGGTSTGDIGAVSDNGDGTYTATLIGKNAGTATNILATINGQDLTSTQPTVTVLPGAISVAQSYITLSASSVTSGSQITATLHARDSNGNNLTSGGATVFFSHVGGTSSGNFAATVDATNGSYTSQFTGITAGSATSIRATIGGTVISTPLPTVTVSPGSIDVRKSSITVGSALVSSGAQTTITLFSKDVNNNTISTGGATVAFSNSGGTSTGIISATTDNGVGTYSATFTGYQSGTPTTIGGTINAASVTSSLPTIAVTYGALSLANSCTQVSAATVSSGSNITLSIQLKDINNNLITASGATVAFASSGGSSTGTIGSVTDAGGGLYTAQFTGGIAGTPTNITTTVAGNAITCANPSIQVIPGAYSINTSILTVSNSTVSSGAQISVQLQLKDAQGNLIPSGGETVAFSRSGGSSNGTFSAVTDNGDGSYSATFTGTTSGTATQIRASINSFFILSTLPTVTVVPGPVSIATSLLAASNSTVASGSAVTLTLTTKDALGNNVTSGGKAVVFSFSGGTSTGTIGSVIDNANGTYQASFTGITAGTSNTFSATINGVAITTSLPSIQVVPGAINLANSCTTLSSGVVASGSNINVTMQAKDGNNNTITIGGASVLFSHAGGSSTGTFSAVTDNGNGTYTATFTGAVSGTSTTIKTAIGANPTTCVEPGVTVTPGSLSLSQSVISLSNASVASGSQITATLTTKDALGNLLTSGGATVLFSLSGAGTSSGTFGAVTDQTNGSYTANFTGTTSGSARQVNATIGGVSISSSLPTITVIPGAISAATSIVSVSAGMVASSSNASLMLAAKDAAGNNLSTGGSTIVFSYSGGTSTGIVGATSDDGNGNYQASFTGLVSGTATTISATINGTPVTTTLPTVQVTPGSAALDNSCVTVSQSVIASSNTSNLTLTLRDAQNNALTTGAGAVAFSYSGGTSTGSIGSVTNNGNGTYSAVFTGSTSGSAISIGATLAGSAITCTKPTITVTPGTISADYSVVSLSSDTVNSGSNITVTLTAKDSHGNRILSGGSTVVFSHSGGSSTGSFGAVTDNTNGTYTSTFTGILSGSATTINATIGGVAVTTTLPTVTVNPGTISAATSQISVSDGTVASGNNITLILVAKDAAGNNLSTGGSTVVFGYSGGTSTGSIGATSDTGTGSYQASFTGLAAGTATTISGTIGGVSVSSTLPTVQVTPGSVSLANSCVTVSSGVIASGGNSNITLTLKDAQNNFLSSGAGTVVLSHTGGSSTGSFGTVTNNGNGTYSAVFTGVVSGTATSIGATLAGSAITCTKPTIIVTPGSISTSESLITASSSTVNSGSNVNITLTANDSNGNRILFGGSTIAFSHSGGSSTGSFSAVTDNGNGTYSATFTGNASGTATTINGTIGGVAVTSTLPEITVNPGSISASTSVITVLGGTVASGGNITLTLTAKDAAGNGLNSGGSTVVFGYSGGTSTGSIGVTSDLGTGSYQALFTGLVSGTATSITATIGGVPVSTTLPTVQVTPGSVSLANSCVTVSSSIIAAGNTSNLTLTLRDAQNNNLTSGAGTAAFSRTGGSSTGTIGSITDNGNGTYSAVFTGNVSGSATNIAATLDGNPITCAKPTVTVTPGAISVDNSLISISSSTVG